MNQTGELAVFLCHSWYEEIEDKTHFKVRAVRIPDETINTMVGTDVLPFKHNRVILPLGFFERRYFIRVRLSELGFVFNAPPSGLVRGSLTYVSFRSLPESDKGMMFYDVCRRAPIDLV